MARKTEGADTTAPAPLRAVATYPDGRPLPRNTRDVPCPLAGYEGLTVRYLVSRSKAEIEAVEGDIYVQLAAMVAGFPAWPFNVAPPTAAGDYAQIGQDFVSWAYGPGYRVALSLALSPN